VVEGATLLAGALDADAEVLSVFVDGGAGPLDVPTTAVVERAHQRGARVFDLAPGVMARVADTVTPQPVLGVVRKPTPPDGGTALRGAQSTAPLGAQSTAPLGAHGTAPLGAGGTALVGPDATFVVVCAQVRDPGNAGTVIRSADAAGADAVVFCESSVDPFNPKTVRAAAGSVLHLPVLEAEGVDEVLVELGAAGLRRLGSAARGGTAPTDVDLRAPCALVLGNEAAGIPEAARRHLDGEMTIPMAGRAESLNVAMAASVLCFEVLRQRSRRGL
jgi:TrmH family RNA methyltransferase